MSQNILDRISFWSVFAVIVLLPIFFLPFSKIPIEISKGLLLVIGLTVSLIFWIAARFSSGKISIPRSRILVAGLCIVLVFLLSSLFSSAKSVSLFGVMFDFGTFWFMVAAFLLMFLSSVVLKDRKKAKLILAGTLLSFVVLFIFQILHLFMPNTLSLGVLGGKTDNIFGAWNSLGLFAGFVSVISLFVVEFFSISKKSKWILKALILLSIIMAAVVDFYLVWVLIGVFALIIFVYKISFDSGVNVSEENKGNFPLASLAVVMVSLLFFMGAN